MDWPGTPFISFRTGVADGVHAARYQIAGKGGGIQRTVEFFIARAGGKAKIFPRSEASRSTGWPLDCLRELHRLFRRFEPGPPCRPGPASIVKMPWYKVVFEDGKEGWVAGTSVKEPTEDFFKLGQEAYQRKNFSAAANYFSNSVKVDPGFCQGTALAGEERAGPGNNDAANEAIKQALRLDERDIDSRVVANTLARRYYRAAISSSGRNTITSGRPRSARRSNLTLATPLPGWKWGGPDPPWPARGSERKLEGRSAERAAKPRTPGVIRRIRRSDGRPRRLSSMIRSTSLKAKRPIKGRPSQRPINRWSP